MDDDSRVDGSGISVSLVVDFGCVWDRVVVVDECGRGGANATDALKAFVRSKTFVVNFIFKYYYSKHQILIILPVSTTCSVANVLQ